VNEVHVLEGVLGLGVIDRFSEVGVVEVNWMVWMWMVIDSVLR
jgi:hypothetical protein